MLVRAASSAASLAFAIGSVDLAVPLSHNHHMKTLITLTTLGALAGCASQLDLDKNARLPETHRRIAVHMVDLAMENCVVGTRRGADESVLRDVSTLNRVLGVKRLYLSHDAWYKAEMAAANMWDSFYYNAVTQEFLCGGRSWGEHPAATDTIFTELVPAS